MKDQVLKIIDEVRQKFAKEFEEFHNLNPRRSQTWSTLNELEERIKHEL